jgi:prophage tail gpP-like protein/phage tail protein X
MAVGTKYFTNTGDTFDSIARKVYGDHRAAPLLIEANAGKSEPFPVDTRISTPPFSSFAKQRTQSAVAGNNDEVVILIEGDRWRWFSDVVISSFVDSFRTASFTAPFDSSNEQFKSTFKPLSFKTIQIFIGGTSVFYGYMVDIAPSMKADIKTISVSCYSFCAPLNDCTAASGSAQQWKGATVDDIARDLARPFGIDVPTIIQDPLIPLVNPVFKDVSIKFTDKILKFLVNLSSQRRLLIADTGEGELVFQKSVNVPHTATRAELVQGVGSPMVAINPSFAPQEHYSHITGASSSDIGTKSANYSITSPLFDGAFRPLNFTAKDIKAGELADNVAAKVARMLGNTVTYKVELNTWRDEKGEVWEPNTTISVDAPDAMIYGSYPFMIKGVDLRVTDSLRSATLTLGLPGSFTGDIPQVFPWD